jgi:hypothetical protein
MNVYLMEAQLFQMVGPTCSSPGGFGASSSGSDQPPLPRGTMVEAFMAAQKGMLCQILQMQQQLVQMLQQQPSFGANPDGPNLVAQIMISTGKDPEKPQPYESCSPRVPTQGDIDTIAGAIEMLEEQNSMLSHIVDNILQDRYQGLSQTSLTDGLSQVLFTSVIEQSRLCNLLVDHMKKNQLSTSDYLLPPSKLPMDLTKEEGKSPNRKQAFPEMDLSEWGITYREFCPHKGKQGDHGGKKPRQQAPKAKELPPRICYNCRQPRHYANKCPNPRRNKPHPQRQGSKENKSHHDKKPNNQVKQGQRDFMGIVSIRGHLSL